jgi:hypothetical protein
MTREARDAAIRRLIDEYTAAAVVSKEKAREALIREGIYTQTGELAPEYQENSGSKNAA